MGRNDTGVNQGECYVNITEHGQSVSSFVTTTNINTAVLLLTRHHTNGYGETFVLSGIEPDMPVLLMCLAGDFTLHSEGISRPYTYAAGYVGFWWPGELSSGWRVSCDKEPTTLVVIQLRELLVKRWSAATEFGFAIWSWDGRSDERRGRLPYRVTDDLVTAMDSVLSEQLIVEADTILSLVDRLGAEVNHAEKYRALFCAAERLEPEISRAGDYLFHVALHGSKDSQSCRLPEVDPFFYLELPQDLLESRTVQNILDFKGWVLRVVKRNALHGLPNVIHHYSATRKPRDGDADVLAQSHRWYAWWLHESVSFSGPWAYHNTPLRLEEESVNQALRVVIEHPRQTLPKFLYVLHDYYCYGIWEDWTDEARGSAKSMLHLLFLLQNFPKAIPWFIGNNMLKMGFVQYGVEVDESVYEELQDIPVVIFFLKDQRDRQRVIGWSSVEMSTAGEEATGFVQKQVDRQVYRAARTMLIYCHGLGYDPATVIQEVMVEFKVSFDYDLLLQQYKRDLETRELGAPLLFSIT